MPKATIDKHTHTGFPKNDVRLAANILFDLGVLAKSQSGAMERTTKFGLSGGLAADVRLHYSANSLTRCRWGSGAN
jgi:hypothetical protein